MIAFLGGIARSIVGAGWVSRGFVYPPAAALCAWWGFGFDWWAIPFAVVPALTLWLGWTRWENVGYMMARYGAAPAVLAVTYFIVTGGFWPLLWAASCTAVGGTYWSMLQAFEDISFSISVPFTDIKIYIDGARIAEFIAGSVIIGGVSLL